MSFKMNNHVHWYYAIATVFAGSMFVFGVYRYWDMGILNADKINAVYEGTSQIEGIKKRNDHLVLKKYVDGDRIKDALETVERIDQDIHELSKIKSPEDGKVFVENWKQLKSQVAEMQSRPELSQVLANVLQKITQFETYVIEHRWPTLSRMTTSLRLKSTPSKIVSGGMVNSDKASSLIDSINNDLEAIQNFITTSPLAADVKQLLTTKVKGIKQETTLLDAYKESHQTFGRFYQTFEGQYTKWVNQIGPEIALTKIDFERNSRTILFGATGMVIVFVLIGVGGFFVARKSKYNNQMLMEEQVSSLLRDYILSADKKMVLKGSDEFTREVDKARDFIQKKLTFGSIYQDTMPFACILLDQNLNLTWANQHFYDQWDLQEFQKESEPLSWDFLQRFTDFNDADALLSAMRLNAPGIYHLQLKTAEQSHSLPYEMYVSPTEYLGEKKILILFYPYKSIEEGLKAQKESLTSPVLKMTEALTSNKLDGEVLSKLKREFQFAGIEEVFVRLNMFYAGVNEQRSTMLKTIEELEAKIHDQVHSLNSLENQSRKMIEMNKQVMSLYQAVKESLSGSFEARSDFEEVTSQNFQTMKEIFKDHAKLLSVTQGAHELMEGQVKALVQVSQQKDRFKELKRMINEFRLRMIQNLDQVLIFQGSTNHDRVEQVLANMKFEIKGFEKILSEFEELSTQLEITTTKITMMNEGREIPDLKLLDENFESGKGAIMNSQFSLTRLSQQAKAKDEEMIAHLKSLVTMTKNELSLLESNVKVASQASPDHSTRDLSI